MDKVKIFKLKYIVNEEDEYIKILGSKFVMNNFKRAKILFKNKLFDLTEKFLISDKSIMTLIIKVIIFSSKINGKDMFKGCSSLLQIIELKQKNSNANNRILLYDKEINNIYNLNDHSTDHIKYLKIYDDNSEELNSQNNYTDDSDKKYNNFYF